MSTINEQTSKPGLRLLVVDDDRHLCYLLRKHLEPEGFVLSAVHTGGEGLREGMKASHELILLDVMLPDTRGFEVLRELRTRVRTPVLMLTAKGEEFDRVLGLGLGADDFLSKPFSPRELHRARPGGAYRFEGQPVSQDYGCRIRPAEGFC